MCFTAIRRLVFCALMWGLTSSTGKSTDFTWNGDGTAFSSPLSWTPSGIPSTSSDRAILDLPGSHTVVFEDFHFCKSFEARAGIWNFNMHDPSGTGWGTVTFRLWPANSAQPAVTIGTTPGLTQVIARSGNTGYFDVQGTLTLGLFAGNIGRLDLDRTRWSSQSSAIIGNAGAGVLVLEGNGARMSNSSVTMGHLDGSLGAANVYHEGLWDLSSTLQVGNRGTGYINIEESGHVKNAGDAFLGVFSGSSGAVTLHHPEAHWENFADLYVGGGSSAAGGNGQLTIDAGRVDVAGDLTIWSTGEVAVNADPPDGATGWGTLDVNGTLTISPDGGFYLDGGGLYVSSAANFRPAANSFHWSAGELQFKSGGLVIGPTASTQAPLGPTVSIETGKKLTVPGALSIGSLGAAQLDIVGGIVTSGSASIGGASSSSVSMTGGAWSSGALAIGGQSRPESTQLLLSSAAQLSSEAVEVAKVPPTTSMPTSSASIELSGAGTLWQATGAVELGWSSTGQYDRGGIGSLAIVSGATMTVGGPLSVGRNFDVVLDGGTLTTDSSATVLGRIRATGVGANTWDLQSSAISPPNPPPRTITIDGGLVDLGADGVLQTDGEPVTIDIRSGGRFVSKINGSPAAHVALTGSHSVWTTPGDVRIGDGVSGVGVIQSLTLGAGSAASVEGSVRLLNDGVLELDGGTIHATSFESPEQDIIGAGTIDAKFTVAQNVTATGNLTFGDAARFDGVSIGGNLTVGAHIVTVNKRGFFNVGTFTSISGGTLAAPGGVSLPTGNALSAFGTVNGKIAAQAGSTIEATGDLTLGDSGSTAGFFSDGELVVNDHTVTLRDANAAALGSLTTLGSGNRRGTLAAAAGLFVDFSGNVHGFGTLDTPNNPSLPTINNGLIQGRSAAEPITLSGYIKGVGAFDDVVFAGTFSPGFSPAAVRLGSAAYDADGTVILELGGTSAGTQYDQLLHDGTALFAGTLDVDLLDGFSPALGQRFTLATFAGRTGQFDDFVFPALGTGLAWSLEYGTHSLVLSVIDSAQLSGDIDLDGDVDRTDVSLFARNYGRTTGSVWTTGDFNADGQTNLLDLSLQQSNFGATVPSPAPSSTAVPEPATWGMALLFVTATLAARSRQRRQ
jgi:T5SS/PEP-CTERM-associated repeat protein